MSTPIRKPVMRVVELEHLSLWERCFFSKKVILNITEAAREETIYFEEEVLKTKSDKIFWTYMVQRVQSWVVEGRITTKMIIRNEKQFLKHLLEDYHCGIRDLMQKQGKSKPSKGVVGYQAYSDISLVNESQATLQTLLEDFTFRQVLHTIDGINWKMREQTDKGKRENKRLLRKDGKSGPSDAMKEYRKKKSEIMDRARAKIRERHEKGLPLLDQVPGKG